MNNYYDYPFDNKIGPANQYFLQPKQTPIDSYEGFIRGNMFDDLYRPYTTSEPYDLKPKNEKEAMMNKVQEYDFAMLDLNLYLDNHPDDQSFIKLYNEYQKKYLNAKNEYEKKYGPLATNSDDLEKNPWPWLNSPWPWEGI